MIVMIVKIIPIGSLFLLMKLVRSFVLSLFLLICLMKNVCLLLNLVLVYSFCAMALHVPHIRCESPRLIYNPKLPSIRSKLRVIHYAVFCPKDKFKSFGFDYPAHVDNVVLDSLGSSRFLNRAACLFDKSFDTCRSVFRMFRSDINLYYKYGGYFYFTDSSGEYYPLFMAVPCNHCAICIERKRDIWAYRCMCETEYHMKPVIATTLTYRNSCLPFGESLSVRDTQLFLKRLRINLVRLGYNEKIRYSICGEYGKDNGPLNGRPHYHVILWNMPYREFGLFKIRSLLEYSWGKGHLLNTHVVRSNPKSYKYQMKYQLKPDYVVTEKYTLGIKSNHHPDRAKPFLHNSCGKLGGIGTPLVRNFVDRNIDLFKRVFNMKKRPQSIFLDPNCLVKFVGNSFVLDKCFKSVSKLLPSDFRRAAVELVTRYDSSTQYLIPFIDKFRQFFYIPSPSVTLNKYKYSISESALIVRKFLARYGLLHPYYLDSYLSDLRDKLVFRDCFLQSNMFNDDFDLVALSSRCRNSLANAKNLEVL